MRRALVALLALLLLAYAPAAQAGSLNEAPYRTLEPTAAPNGTEPTPFVTVAPEESDYPRIAVTAPGQDGGTVPLYASPDGTGDVLMEYYAGVRVSTLREAMPGFVLVQVGTAEAGLMGYMRKSNLRFGVAALREIRPEYVKIVLNREATVYAWCDEFSGVIGTFAQGEQFYAIGKNDGKWVQLASAGNAMVALKEDLVGWQRAEDMGVAADGTSGIVSGFVQMITGLGRGYESAAVQWEVEPVSGEMTREQAIEQAVEAVGLSGLAQKLRGGRDLREMETKAAWMYAQDAGLTQLTVTVEFDAGEQTLFVCLNADGSPNYAGIRDEEGNWEAYVSF